MPRSRRPSTPIGIALVPPFGAHWLVRAGRLDRRLTLVLIEVETKSRRLCAVRMPRSPPFLMSRPARLCAVDRLPRGSRLSGRSIAWVGGLWTGLVLVGHMVRVAVVLGVC